MTDEYTPSMEEVAARFQASSRNEFGHRDPRHKTDLEFNRFVAVIRADERRLQAEKDAHLAKSMADNEPDGYYGQACFEVAAEIRTQFVEQEAGKA